MKKILTILLLIISISVFPQTDLNKTPNFGKQFENFSLSFAFENPQLYTVSIDSVSYFEIKGNLNVFQQGKFKNKLTIGGGIFPSGRTKSLFEICYTLEYSLSKKVHINIIGGEYYYSNFQYPTNNVVVGISLVYFFEVN